MKYHNCTQIYQSVTTWQAEDWQIEVNVGNFLTIGSAANFGAKKVRKLKCEPNTDYLTLIDNLGHCHRIGQECVKVYKLLL